MKNKMRERERSYQLQRWLWSLKTDSSEILWNENKKSQLEKRKGKQKNEREWKIFHLHFTRRKSGCHCGNEQKEVLKKLHSIEIENDTWVRENKSDDDEHTKWKWKWLCWKNEVVWRVECWYSVSTRQEANRKSIK